MPELPEVEIVKRSLKKKIKDKIYVVGKILNKKKGVYLLDNHKKIKLGKGFDHFR